jgi:hypothetical protein
VETLMTEGAAYSRISMRRRAETTAAVAQVAVMAAIAANLMRFMEPGTVHPGKHSSAARRK